jgi:hypothetical protein
MRGGRRIRCGATGGKMPCDEESPGLKKESVVGSRCTDLPQRYAVGVGFLRKSCQEHSGHDLAAVRHAAVASDGLAGNKIGRGRREKHRKPN